MDVERQTAGYENEGAGFTPDDKVASLFQPDALLSAQFFDNLRRRTIPEPEKRLMLAILEDAIHCFRDNQNVIRGKRKRDFDAAAEWIFNGGSDWVFSFTNICDALGLSPEYLRQGLCRWKENSGKAVLPSRNAASEKLAG